MIFIFFSAWNSQGCKAEADPPCHSLHLPSGSSDLFLWDIFYFYKVHSPKTWGFGEIPQEPFNIAHPALHRHGNSLHTTLGGPCVVACIS